MLYGPRQPAQGYGGRMKAESVIEKSRRDRALAEIAALIGGRLSTAPAVRQQHGKDLTWNPGLAPDAVAFVESISEIQEIVKICGANTFPIIPYGTGTSLEGHIGAPLGGLTIDLSGMN